MGALANANALQAKTGETICIFFGVGGPNFTSYFRVIGEIFGKIYPMGSVTSGTFKDVQTVTVPPGGAMFADFKLEVPGAYVLVDHALSRVNRGLAGFLNVTGPENPKVFMEGLPQRTSTLPIN